MTDTPHLREAHDVAGLPPAVLERLGRSAELVWTNELGGRTFRLDGGARYLKWQPHDGLSSALLADVDLPEEARRLDWAGRFLSVPQVLDVGTVPDVEAVPESRDIDDGAARGAGTFGTWLLTAGLPGENPLTGGWTADPATAVPAIARGLRRLHEALPVEDCPFTCRWLDGRLADAPEPERLVVCHGDPCVPNTLLDSDGQAIAHVDLGALGVADRWADLAIASMSISWDVNFGPGHDDLFFDAYGVEPDAERIEFYRALWTG